MVPRTYAFCGFDCCSRAASHLLLGAHLHAAGELVEAEGTSSYACSSRHSWKFFSLLDKVCCCASSERSKAETGGNSRSDNGNESSERS